LFFIGIAEAPLGHAKAFDTASGRAARKASRRPPSTGSG